MYYIYHIPSRQKIGVTIDIKRRMRSHKLSSGYEILEEHTDIYEVSNREQELQRQYGYRVDTVPYYQAVANSEKIDRVAAGRKIPREAQVRGGRNSKPNLPKEVLQKSMKMRRECPHCGKVSTPALIGRWHGDNCKLSPS
jgi:hypothetical protein